MKVALIHLWSPPYNDNRAAGLIYGLENIKNDLEVLGHQVEYFTPYVQGKKDQWHEGYHHFSLNKLDYINSFDFGIFSSLGAMKDKKDKLPWWGELIKCLEIPFGAQINNEVDESILVFREYFYRNKNFKLLLPITSGLKDPLADKYGIPTLVYLNFPKVHGYVDYQDYYQQKQDKIVTTCRMTSRKRVLELVQQSESLYNKGFHVSIHGSDIMYFYVTQVKSLINEDIWHYGGWFSRNQLSEILTTAKFHYNCCYLKRQQVSPRIEIATVEAVHYGCCPILSKQTVPDWVTNDMAVLVDTNDLSDLAERLDSVREVSHIMHQNFWESFQTYNNINQIESLVNIMKQYSRSL